MNNGEPYSYDYINRYNSCISPSTMHAMGTGQYRLFYRLFLERAMSIFRWKIQDNWDLNYTLYSLFEGGYFCIFNTRRFGIIPQWCGLYGYNVMYQPTNALVSNPAFHTTLDLKINVNCVLIKLRPNYASVYDIVNYYSCMAALATESIDINLLNSHIAYLFLADNKAAGQTMKKMYDKVAGGEPAVFTDARLYDNSGNRSFEMLHRDIKSTFIVPELLDVLRGVFEMFDREVGIPTVPQKKERLIQSESDRSTAGTFCKGSLWLEEINRGITRAKKMFPELILECEWRWNDDGSLYNANGVSTSKSKDI